jgi:hypothetical protein
MHEPWWLARCGLHKEGLHGPHLQRREEELGGLARAAPMQLHLPARHRSARAVHGMHAFVRLGIRVLYSQVSLLVSQAVDVASARVHRPESKRSASAWRMSAMQRQNYLGSQRG